jgi:hypothetical protein
MPHFAEAYQRRSLVDGLNGINKEKDFDTALEKALRDRASATDEIAGSEGSIERSIDANTDYLNSSATWERRNLEKLNNLALDSRWNPKEVRELVELLN